MLKLSESKNINSSVEKFFQEYDALKKSEDWKGIIDIGLKALEDSKITNENLALIKCKLTSCYYYLGQFEEALKVAKGALEGATQADKKELQARSLYLISAIYRALFLKASEEEKTEQKYKESASENIERALKLLSEHDVSDFTKAKVYFNAGALEHEVNVSLNNAIVHYLQAMKIFKAHSFDDDYNRTAIRYIRAIMEDGRKQLDEIETEARELNISKETRTGVQFSLLMSRIFIKHEKYDKAYQCATDALEVAKSKSMQTEITMLEQIISKEQERRGNDVSSSLNNVVIGREDKRQHVPH